MRRSFPMLFCLALGCQAPSDSVPPFAGPGGLGDDCVVGPDCRDQLVCVEGRCAFGPSGQAIRDSGAASEPELGVPDAVAAPDVTTDVGEPSLPPTPRFIRFEEVGDTSGVRKPPSHGSAGVLDYDGDGLLDLFVTEPGVSISLFRNQGGGHFIDMRAAAGLVADGRAGGFGALVADYDNDGDPDVYVTRDGFAEPARNSLYRNNGDGTFSDVGRTSNTAGLAITIGAAFLDYDLDGWVDLYVVNGVKQGQPNQLYHNNGDGSFSDVTTEAGVGDAGVGYQVAVGDYDADGYPDLYVVNRRGLNVLYHNRGDGSFEDRSIQAGVSEPDHALAALFVDYDADGQLDLLVAPENQWDHIRRWKEGRQDHGGLTPLLYRNNGDGTFSDVAAAAGLREVFAGRSIVEADLDNDGLIDLVVGAGGPGPGPAEYSFVYRNKGDGTFDDVARIAGLGPTAMTHGMALFDYDSDGFSDLYMVNGHTNSDVPHGNTLYRNLGNENHWLRVHLRGTVSNRDGIGARVVVAVDGKLQVREVRGGQAFASTNAKALTFGLGKASRADRVEIWWPGGGHTSLEDVAADQVLELVEGAAP